MATTSPDNIWTPDAGDNYALTTDLAAMADTVQDALSARGYVVGTNAQRLALAGGSLFNGLRFFASDTGIEWVYNGTTWTWAPRNLARLEMSGNQNITGSLAQVTGLSQNITAPAAGRVRMTLSITSYSGSTTDLLKVTFRDGTTAMWAGTDAANSSPSQPATGKTRTFVYDAAVASGAHTLNVAAHLAVGSAGTIQSNAAERTFLIIDWLG